MFPQYFLVLFPIVLFSQGFADDFVLLQFALQMLVQSD
jgi:uncharacterized membrane protein YkvA (DUF1232 family)